MVKTRIKSFHELMESSFDEVTVVQETFCKLKDPSLKAVLKDTVPGDFVFFAGRPMMGQDALIRNLALELSAPHCGSKKVLFVDNQRSWYGLVTFVLRGLFNRKERKQFSTKELLEMSKERVQNLHFLLNEELDTQQLIQDLKHVVCREEIEVLVIQEFKQMIPGNVGNSWSNLFRNLLVELVHFAKEAQITIFASTTVSPDVEWRGGDKRPVLSDMYPCDIQELVANKIILVYRPEYYGLTCNPDGSSTDGQLELICHTKRTQEIRSLTFYNDCML